MASSQLFAGYSPGKKTSAIIVETKVYSQPAVMRNRCLTASTQYKSSASPESNRRSAHSQSSTASLFLPLCWCRGGISCLLIVSRVGGEVEYGARPLSYIPREYVVYFYLRSHTRKPPIRSPVPCRYRGTLRAQYCQSAFVRGLSFRLCIGLYGGQGPCLSVLYLLVYTLERLGGGSLETRHQLGILDIV
jgi:hypothetical protein